MRRLVTLNSPRPLFLPIAVVIAIAVVRQLWWQYVVVLRGPLGLAGIPLIACPFLVICLVSLAVLGFTIFRSVTRTRSLLPTLVLFGGILLAFQIPLPPRPDTPEKAYFLAHRAAYEAVVEIVRAGDLEPRDRPGSIRTDIFEPPEQYAYVSTENCLEVSRNRCGSLAVTFFPLEPFYHHIVYTDSGETDCMCGRDPHVEQEIDSNWYVCEYEWN